MTDSSFDPSDGLPRFRGRRILFVALLIIVLGGAAAVAAFLRRQPNPTSSPSGTSPVVSTGEISQPSVTLRDADGDRLSDEEEADLGTDAALGDTDHDGLGDYEEARVWQSDPKRADTDGDGGRDGDEVRRGTSPTGSGLLRDPNAITNANSD